MAQGELTSLQRRVLEVLAGVEPPWTLTGGGALVGFHLHHRTTRDLDLFWHGRARLGPEREACIRLLCSDDLEVDSIQRDAAIERLLVSDGSDRVVVDLVAEPVDSTEAPMRVILGSHVVLVDTPHEILVNKLCALLGRSELRDLLDVQALLGRGEDLDRAIRGAARKDSGFSAVSLAWVLRGLPIEALARTARPDEPGRTEIERLRDGLVDRLVRATRPGR